MSWRSCGAFPTLPDSGSAWTTITAPLPADALSDGANQTYTDSTGAHGLLDIEPSR